MSRFFATISDSDTESESSEEVDVPNQRPVVTSAFQFSDEEEESKRVVRSSKEKRYEELQNLVKSIRMQKKNREFVKLLATFDDLVRAFTKAKLVIGREGDATPIFFVRSLVELEDHLNEVWEQRDKRKDLSKTNLKALSTFRQKLKKYSKDFEDEIEAYRENPEIEDEQEDEKSDVSAEESEVEEDEIDTNEFKKVSFAPVRKSKLIKGEDEDDDESEDSYWDTGSADSSSSSSDDDQYGENLAAKFLKRSPDREAERVTEKKRKDKKEKRERRRDEEEDGEWKEVRDGARVIVKPKMFAKDVEISVQVVVKKLNEVVAVRSKKVMDRSEQIDMLMELYSITQSHDLGPAVAVKVMFALIISVFNYNTNVLSCIRLDMWNRSIGNIRSLVKLLTDNPDITVGEHIAEDSESLAEPPFRVRGCLITIVERLDEEFNKMLQGCDAHGPEYVHRLKNENTVCDVIELLQVYLETRGNSSELCRVYLRRIEHIYYKFDPTVMTEQGEKATEGENSIQLMDKLCKYIYSKDDTDRIRTRSMLCHIYHHALHDRWYAARDLMLMSHMQDTIHHSDIPTQILYNRTMVQVGLCAFRHGNIRDAHSALLDIQSGGRAKELLAQGLLMQRQHERTSEQEKIEKRRQMPFHMHINLELLECVYLVSAMLLEIPYMAAHEFEARRRIISKNFNHQLKISDRQALVGPPETMREHVVAAAKAMRNGNWEGCKNLIINPKMNTKVWDLFHEADKVRNMLTTKIKEETLCTYLFTYSSVYNSISMDTLGEMFKLERATVHSIISKMIINEELMVSLDEPTHTVVMHRTEPTHLQSLALQLADKLCLLVENNERMYEFKQGSFFARGQQNYQRQGGYGRQQGGYSQGHDWSNKWGRRYQRQYN